METINFDDLDDEELERRCCMDFEDDETARNQDIVTRQLWEAREPAEKDELLKVPILNVLVGYTDTGTCENNIVCVVGVKRLQSFYIDTLKENDLPYSFLIGGHGAIYEGRGWKYQPKLPHRFEHLKERSIYIGLFGDFFSAYSSSMLIARNRLIRLGMDRGFISKKILFHFITRNKINPIQLLTSGLF